MVREHEHPGERVILFSQTAVGEELGFPARQLALARVQDALAVIQLADADRRLAAAGNGGRLRKECGAKCAYRGRSRSAIEVSD